MAAMNVKALRVSAVAVLLLLSPLASASTPASIQVQPGMAIDVAGTGCTLAFLVRGSDHQLYGSTAGHCAPPTPTTVIRVSTVLGRPLGVIVYLESWSIPGSNPTRDFALIRFDRGIEANPAVMTWGGPTGLLTGSVSSATTVNLYGQGLGVSAVTPARTGLMPASTDIEFEHVVIAASPGDSGAPVLTSGGLAIGSLIGFESGNPGIGTQNGRTEVAPGFLVMRLDSALGRASHKLHMALALIRGDPGKTGSRSPS